MDYIRHYIKLIRKAELTELQGYCEKHHVFPKSIFGNNNYIVKLTARQHYIAHALLEKIYIKRYGLTHKNTKKMIHAFFMMNNAIGNGQSRYINSRLFEASKLRFSKCMSGENSHMYGKKRVFTEEHLENLKHSRKKGKDHPLYGIPRTEAVKEKIRKPKKEGHGEKVSASRKGIKFTEDHRKNLSLSHMGNEPGNKGKPHSDETKKKMKEACNNKDYSFMDEEYKKKLSESMKQVWAERKKKRHGESLNE